MVLCEDPAIPLLSIYPEDVPPCNKDTCYVHRSKNPDVLQQEWIQSKIQVTADAGKDVDKEEHSSIVCGIASLYNPSGNQSGGSLENWT